MKHTVILEVEVDDQDAVPDRSQEEASTAAVSAARLAVMSGRAMNPTMILTVKAAYAEEDAPDGGGEDDVEVAAHSGAGTLNTDTDPNLDEGLTKDREIAEPGRVESVSGSRMPDEVTRQDMRENMPATRITHEGVRVAATQPAAVDQRGGVRYGSEASKLYGEQGGQYATEAAGTRTTELNARGANIEGGGQPFTTSAEQADDNEEGSAHDGASNQEDDKGPTESGR